MYTELSCQNMKISAININTPLLNKNPNKNTVIPKIFAPNNNSKGPKIIPKIKNTHLNFSIKLYITLPSIYGHAFLPYALIV